MSAARQRVEVLSDLRAPPEVGRFYLVPVIEQYPWYDHVSDWPVIGPKHTDQEFFAFEPEHYHLDWRFLTARQVEIVRRWRPRRYRGLAEDPGIVAVSGAPLSSLGTALPKAGPVLRRRRCQAASYRSILGDVQSTVFSEFQAHYGAPAAPIHLADGRILCPHRKADLSQFPPDEDGVVTCPLHGLRVCVRSNLEVAA